MTKKSIFVRFSTTLFTRQIYQSLSLLFLYLLERYFCSRNIDFDVLVEQIAWRHKNCIGRNDNAQESFESMSDAWMLKIYNFILYKEFVARR